MIIQRKTWFISDLHLDENQPKITQLFLALLYNESSVDTLYILGDLFEVWIGDDDNTPYHQQIIQALKSATQKGLPIYIIPGNRDFLLGERFFRESGCQLLADEQVISLYQTPVLLMHGDTLCTKDIAYLRFRKVVRNPIVQKLFLLLPLNIRLFIAKKLRKKSKMRTASTPLDIMDVTQAEVERVMQKHKVDYLIHGHTHRPQIQTIAEKTRIVLGAWHEYGSVLVWDETGKKELKELK